MIIPQLNSKITFGDFYNEIEKIGSTYYAEKVKVGISDYYTPQPKKSGSMIITHIHNNRVLESI
jgi:hypothetical protein